VDRRLHDVGVGADGDFRVFHGHRWLAERLSTGLADRSAAVAPGWWKDAWRSDTATIAVGLRGGTVLTVRRGPYARRGRSFSPPPGTRIEASTRPAVVQNGPVIVTLLDAEGERDLGLLDPGTGRWRIIEYAWEPVVSPAPPALGPLAASRAVSLVEQLLWRLRRAGLDPGLVLADAKVADLGSLRKPGFAMGEPELAGAAWRVPVTLYGATSRGFAVRRVGFVVRPSHGRLVVRVGVVGPLVPIRTIEDAMRALRSVLTVPTAPLPTLPAGTTLDRAAISAWTWRGVTTGQINLLVPTVAGRSPLSFHFGDAGFGCVQPVPVTLSTGTAAVATDPEAGLAFTPGAGPAPRPRAMTGPFGISAELPRATVLALAGEMDRAPLAAGDAASAAAG
jgi:hypothetical protein